jgi:hypothetical protein
MSLYSWQLCLSLSVDSKQLAEVVQSLLPSFFKTAVSSTEQIQGKITLEASTTNSIAYMVLNSENSYTKKNG